MLGYAGLTLTLAEGSQCAFECLGSDGALHLCDRERRCSVEVSSLRSPLSDGICSVVTRRMAYVV